MNGKTDIKKISTDLDLPTPFLAKILQQLAKHKMLSSARGPHGGFRLTKDPRKITLLDIVNIIDGEDTFTTCIMHNGPCKGLKKNKKQCPLHDDYDKISRDIIELFSSRTIYDLATGSSNTKLITI